MNRLQKKCFIVATGMHLLLVVILIVGPAFLSSSSKSDESKVLEMIPFKLIDSNFSGGGGNPSPAPPPAQPAPQAPVQPAAKVVEPVKVSQPDQKQVKPESKPEPKPLPKPAQDSSELNKQAKPIKPKPPVPTQLVIRNTNDSKAAAEAVAAANAAAARRTAELNTSLRNLRTGLNSKTDIKTSPGLGGIGEPYADYSSAIKSVYYTSWIEPSSSASDASMAEVTVTIARDGTVISAHISQMSGDEQTDASIQRTLDHVKFIAPFPQSWKDTQRTFILTFSLKAKRGSA